MTQTELKVIAAWRKAADDLGIQFSAPFIGVSNGKRFEALGLVHHFGARIGTLISVGGEPSAEIDYPSNDDFAWSCLGRTGYTRYSRKEWMAMLDDWGFWGPEKMRPPWVKG